MSWRKLLAAACLLVLLLLAALGGAVVVARPEPRPAPRKVAPRRHLSAKEPGSGDGAEAFQKTRSFGHRKLAATTTKAPKNSPKSVEFNVDNNGAAGDGKSDDTKAFQEAWAKACSSPQPAAVLVTAGKKYLVKETPLSGPCKSQVTFKIDGTLVAPEDKTDWNKHGYPHWVSFTNVDHLTITGKGILDGAGKSSWKNYCRVNPKRPCTFAPAALTFSSCNHLKVENIKLINSPQIHLFVQYCRDVMLSHLTITAPGNALEADGIHNSHTEDIKIIKPVIKAGDNCISIATGTKNLYASNVECGPGHGISIGSLGNKNSEAQVSNITIDTAYLSGTMFGARIKTWQGGSGYAKDIKFLNMVMDNVKHPILIDPYYCTQPDPSKPKPCEEQPSAVQLSNILFKNIRGTGITKYKDVINLHCSKSFPCRDVVLQDIDLKLKNGGEKNVATSSCENVKLSKSSNVSPAPCTSVATRNEWIQDLVE